MSFITQGKTNVLYLVIVLAIAIAVGFFIFNYYHSLSADSEDSSKLATEDLSNGLFINKSIEAPYIEVLYPNGGEKWKINTPQTITWKVMVPEGFKAIHSGVIVYLEKEGVVEYGGRLTDSSVSSPKNSFIWDGLNYWQETNEGGRTDYQVEPGDGYRIQVRFVWTPPLSPRGTVVPNGSVSDVSNATFSIVE